MALGFADDSTTIAVRTQKFLNDLNLGNIRNSFNIIDEHSDRIIDIDNDFLTNANKSRFGIGVKCDSAFTLLGNQTITIKVADCTTALVYAYTNSKELVVGIVHTGRRSVGKLLPKKAIKHLIEKYNCEPDKIFLGIFPHLFYENRKFENLDNFENLNVWDGYIEEKDGFFYPKETEFAVDQYLESGVREENRHNGKFVLINLGISLISSRITGNIYLKTVNV